MESQDGWDEFLGLLSNGRGVAQTTGEISNWDILIGWGYDDFFVHAQDIWSSPALAQALVLVLGLSNQDGLEGKKGGPGMIPGVESSVIEGGSSGCPDGHFGCADHSKCLPATWWDVVLSHKKISNYANLNLRNLYHVLIIIMETQVLWRVNRLHRRERWAIVLSNPSLQTWTVQMSVFR